jgi:hypothetical protein
VTAADPCYKTGATDPGVHPTAMAMLPAVMQRGGYARSKPRRQSRYVIRLPAILAKLCRIVHR